MDFLRFYGFTKLTRRLRTAYDQVQQSTTFYFLFRHHFIYIYIYLGGTKSIYENVIFKPPLFSPTLKDFCGNLVEYIYIFFCMLLDSYFVVVVELGFAKYVLYDIGNKIVK